jgi:hypothetical protein
MNRDLNSVAFSLLGFRLALTASQRHPDQFKSLPLLDSYFLALFILQPLVVRIYCAANGLLYCTVFERLITK